MLWFIKILEDFTLRLSKMPLDGDVVLTARDLGICLGDEKIHITKKTSKGFVRPKKVAILYSDTKSDCSLVGDPG